MEILDLEHQRADWTGKPHMDGKHLWELKDCLERNNRESQTMQHI